MTEVTEAPQFEPAIKFEPTKDGHRITFDPGEREVDVAAALAASAYRTAKPAPTQVPSGYSEYRSGLTPEEAKRLVEETHEGLAGKDTLFYMNYHQGREVRIGAKRLPDGGIVLVDREGKPIPSDKAQRIADSADGNLDRIKDPQWKNRRLQY